MAEKIEMIRSVVDDLDNSLTATRKRTFAVGKRRYEIDLSDENAARFDREFGFWVKAARRLPDAGEEPGADMQRRAGAASVPDLILPVPVQGQEWWMDPPRPFSRQTGEAFAEARRFVRDFARTHGWPDIGERGMVPRDAYRRWFDEVWSQMDEPSWGELRENQARAAAGRVRDGLKARPRPKKPATTRKP
jgi:hypothetical protein